MLCTVTEKHTHAPQSSLCLFFVCRFLGLLLLAMQWLLASTATLGWHTTPSLNFAHQKSASLYKLQCEVVSQML